LLFIFLFS